MRARRDWSYVAGAIVFLSAAALALVGGAAAPPLAPGSRECVGSPAEICQARVAELEQGGGDPRGPRGVPARLHVRGVHLR
jgi:hypothetical protein